MMREVRVKQNTKRACCKNKPMVSKMLKRSVEFRGTAELVIICCRLPITRTQDQPLLM